MRISLPLVVIMPRKKKADKRFFLNLNVYRTSPFRTIAAAKVIYATLVLGALNDAIDYEKFGSDRVRLIYTLFPASKRRVDIANPLSIVDKFAADCLVGYGIIDDDSANIVSEVIFRFGHLDSKNPRAELLIQRM